MSKFGESVAEADSGGNDTEKDSKNPKIYSPKVGAKQLTTLILPKTLPSLSLLQEYQSMVRYQLAIAH